MKENDIDCFDITNGKLIYTKKKTKSPLSKKHLLQALSAFFKDDKETVSKISNYILDTRETKIKENIRRKIKK